MAGNSAGGRKAAKTNIEKYGEDFYARIGRRGGKNGNTGGFASLKEDENGLTGPERARLAGAIGGSISRRTGVHNGEHKATEKKTEKTAKITKRTGFFKKIFGGK